ncbi:MAG: ATP-grasp domain-containing protein [Flammeovirgaceae bacterium]
MITKVYIQHEDGELIPTRQHICGVLEARGVAYQLFSAAAFHQEGLELNKHTAVACNLGILKAVLKQIGFEDNPPCYPTSLNPYLKREIWERTIGELLAQSEREAVPNIFIKPQTDIKLFKGFVLQDEDDLELIDDLPPETKLYCSEVVDWYSEYRVYVHDSKIIGVKNYKGDPSVEPNLQEIEAAVAVFEQSADCTAGYGIDFGVLLNGATALVEWNDGMALGNYGLAPEAYTDLFLTRWEQVLQHATRLG